METLLPRMRWFEKLIRVPDFLTGQPCLRRGRHPGRRRNGCGVASKGMVFCAMLCVMRRRSPILVLLATLAAVYLLLAPFKQCFDRMGRARPLNTHDGELMICFALVAAGAAVALANAYQVLRRRAQRRLGAPEVLCVEGTARELAAAPLDLSPPLALLRI